MKERVNDNEVKVFSTSTGQITENKIIKNITISPVDYRVNIPEIILVDTLIVKHIQSSLNPEVVEYVKVDGAITSQNQFRVEQVANGTSLLFHSSRANKPILAQYNATAKCYSSAENIYVYKNSDGTISKSLKNEFDEIIDSNRAIVSNMNEINGNMNIVNEDILNINEDVKKIDNTKVNKEGNKGLSTYDYNDTEKNKSNNALDKATQALEKAQNPLSALTSAGYKMKPSECSKELLDIINGNGTINIGQGLLVNQGEEYPLQRTTINGVLDDSMNDFVKKTILDVQVLNAKEGKTYQINWLGNGYTGFGENAKYGFQIVDYDTNSMSASTSSMRTQVAYGDYNFPTPIGTVTRMIRGRYDNVIFLVTVDYSALGSNTFLSTSAFGTSVIHQSKYAYTLANPKSLSVNKTNDYPFIKFIQSEKDLHGDIQKAILDVKIVNANPNKIYKIEWLGNGNTAWITPEYAVYLNEYDITDTTLSNPRLVFDRNNAHLDAPENTIETRLISASGESVSLNITIDYSKLRYDRYPMNSVDGAGKGHIIDKSCYYVNSQNAIIPNVGDTSYDLAISYDGEQNIKVKQRYSLDKNLVITFGQLGINKLTHFKKVSYKVEDKFTNDFNNLEEKYAITSDWLSPYGMKALNNTVDSSAITVGGNHGTNNGAGFPTASHISTEVFVDGNKVNVGDIMNAKNSIEIVAKHYISASNVINKTTGAKRNSCIETVLYKIYKDTIYVTVTLEALEDVNMTRYCGLQMTAPPLSMQDKLYFMFENGFNDYLVADYTSKEIHSCLKSQGELDRFNYYGANDMVVCYRDKFVGISDFRYIANDDFPIYKSSGTKVYMHNISQKKPVNVALNQGDVMYWAGGYTFASTGLKCQGVKKAYTIMEQGQRVYCVDFNKTTPTTYLEPFAEDLGKFIEIVNKSANVTCDNYITSKGLKVSSNGFGQLKFKIK